MAVGAGIGLCWLLQRHHSNALVQDPVMLAVESGIESSATDFLLTPLVIEGAESLPDLERLIKLPDGRIFNDVGLDFDITLKSVRGEPFSGAIRVNAVVDGLPSDSVKVVLPTLQPGTSITHRVDLVLHSAQLGISMVPIGVMGPIKVVVNLSDRDTGEFSGTADSEVIGWVL